jgi:hypothetical protein
MGQVRVVGGDRGWQSLHPEIFIDAPTNISQSPGGDLNLVTAGATVVAFFTPGDFFADPAARLLGVTLHHDLSASDTIELVRIESRTHAVEPIVTVLKDISSLFTLDGTQRTQDVSFNNSVLSTLPAWCNGEAVKGSIINRSSAPGIEGLAIRITNVSGANDAVSSLLWTIAR